MIGGQNSSEIVTERAMGLHCHTRQSRQRRSLPREEAGDTQMEEEEEDGLRVEMVGFQGGAIMLVVEMADAILGIQMEDHLEVVEEDVEAGVVEEVG